MLEIGEVWEGYEGRGESIGRQVMEGGGGEGHVDDNKDDGMEAEKAAINRGVGNGERTHPSPQEGWIGQVEDSG